MPLKKGGGKKAVGKNIAEFHTGGTYKRTKKKFGKATADAQAVAASMRAAGVPPKKGINKTSEREMERYASRRGKKGRGK